MKNRQFIIESAKELLKPAGEFDGEDGLKRRIALISH